MCNLSNLSLAIKLTAAYAIWARGAEGQEIGEYFTGRDCMRYFLLEYMRTRASKRALAYRAAMAS